MDNLYVNYVEDMYKMEFNVPCIYDSGKQEIITDTLEEILAWKNYYKDYLKTYTISDLLDLPIIYEETLSINSAIDTLDIYKNLNTFIEPEYEQLEQNDHLFSNLCLSNIVDNKELGVKLYVLYELYEKDSRSSPVALIFQTPEDIDIHVLDTFWLHNFLYTGFSLMTEHLINSRFDINYEEELEKPYKLFNNTYSIDKVIN